MVILSAKQIREWDAFTTQHKPITSIELMESAAIKCFQWIQQNNFTIKSFHVFCGKGNNGGDGLALARMLSQQGRKVDVHILELGQNGTADFQTNLARIHETSASIHYIQSGEHFPVFQPGEMIIDALFGTGLNRKLEGLAAETVNHLSASLNTVISIDMPSGMLADETSKDLIKVKATYTLSFQCLKLAFMMAENEIYTGIVSVIDIGLLNNFLSQIVLKDLLLEEDYIKAMYRPRLPFSHKGTYGHAAIIAGSYGFMGAATLAASACLRSGVGKITCHIPACGYDILQISVPEAMSKVEQGFTHITTLSNTEKYNAVGIGPGWGISDSHHHLLDLLCSSYKKPMVLDADALTILSHHHELVKKIFPFSILTPHPGEFERLFGHAENDFDRMRKATQKAKELQLIIVLKGHRTFIAMPGGINYFNSTGNPGMATGGSGDVLTGIITGLLAQGYPPEQAALFGVYVHGLAGDFAATALTQEAMIASDITGYLSNAFYQIAH